MDIVVNIDHISITHYSSDDEVVEAIDKLSEDMNEWAATLNHRYNPPSPLRTRLSQSGPPTEGLLREIFGDDHPVFRNQMSLPTMLAAINRQHHLTGALGRDAINARGQSMLAAAIVDACDPDDTFHDLHGTVAIVTPTGGTSVSIQYWPIEDAKSLVNMLGTVIARAETLQDAPEARQDGL